MKSMTITPEKLDEMGLEKIGTGYCVVGLPVIYIDFWGDGSARVYVVAAPGEEVEFPNVTTTERLEMLLDAISSTPTAQEAFDALFDARKAK